MSERVFIADYDRTGLVHKVWLPLGLAALVGLAGTLTGAPVFLLMALGLFAIALHFWPLVRKEKPALKLSNSGVEIDALGFAPWSNIRNVEQGQVMVRGEKLAAIDISFRKPLPQSVSISPATRLRPWEIRAFRLRRDGKIRLSLARIAESPDDLMAAFRHFTESRRL